MANTYSEFLVEELDPISAEVQAATDSGPALPESGLPFAQRNDLLTSGELPLETGYTCLPDSMQYVAVRHDLPGVTAKMIEWWFGWHGCESARYRLWHPKDHKESRWKSPAPSENAKGEAAYVGHTALVAESINGGRVINLAIRFRPPAEFFDAARWQTAINDGRVTTAICGRVGLQSPPIDSGHVVHLVRDTPGGCVMRSRFWLGDLAPRGPLRALKPFINRPAVRARIFKSEDARDLTIHCAQEMRHFTRFLPRLHDTYAPR